MIGLGAGERDPNVRERGGAVDVENREGLAGSYFAVVGVASGTIEARDALEDRILGLREIYFGGCGLRGGRWQNCVGDKQREQSQTERVHRVLLLAPFCDLLGGLCTERSFLTSVLAAGVMQRKKRRAEAWRLHRVTETARNGCP